MRDEFEERCGVSRAVMFVAFPCVLTLLSGCVPTPGGDAAPIASVAAPESLGSSGSSGDGGSASGSSDASGGDSGDAGQAGASQDSSAAPTSDGTPYIHPIDPSAIFAARNPQDGQTEVTSTFGIGAGGTVNVGPFAATGHGGFVIDDRGNVGLQYGGGFGPGAGAGASVGAYVDASNAKTIEDQRGGFLQVNGNVGLGPDVGGSVYTGSSSHGQVTGAQFQLGAGAGGGTSLVGTYSGVVKVGHVR